MFKLNPEDQLAVLVLITTLPILIVFVVRIVQFLEHRSMRIEHTCEECQNKKFKLFAYNLEIVWMIISAFLIILPFHFLLFFFIRSVLVTRLKSVYLFKIFHNEKRKECWSWGLYNYFEDD